MHYAADNFKAEKWRSSCAKTDIPLISTSHSEQNVVLSSDTLHVCFG